MVPTHWQLVLITKSKKVVLNSFFILHQAAKTAVVAGT
jgi:hypothetical protein